MRCAAARPGPSPSAPRPPARPSSRRGGTARPSSPPTGTVGVSPPQASSASPGTSVRSPQAAPPPPGAQRAGQEAARLAGVAPQKAKPRYRVAWAPSPKPGPTCEAARRRAPAAQDRGRRHLGGGTCPTAVPIQLKELRTVTFAAVLRPLLCAYNLLRSGRIEKRITPNIAPSRMRRPESFCAPANRRLRHDLRTTAR